MTSTQPRTAAFLQREHVAYDAMWVAFAEGLEAENAVLREAMAAIYLALGTNEADHTKWAGQIERLRTGNAALLTFVQRIARQKPERPDYWTPCGQCGHNAEDAEDLLEDISPL